jgi:hypothetical protein
VIYYWFTYVNSTGLLHLSAAVAERRAEVAMTSDFQGSGCSISSFVHWFNSSENENVRTDFKNLLMKDIQILDRISNKVIVVVWFDSRASYRVVNTNFRYSIVTRTKCSKTIKIHPTAPRQKQQRQTGQSESSEGRTGEDPVYPLTQTCHKLTQNSNNWTRNFIPRVENEGRSKKFYSDSKAYLESVTSILARGDDDRSNENACQWHSASFVNSRAPCRFCRGPARRWAVLTDASLTVGD